ncbi:hypothetical protein [Actinoplanes sp. NPDC049316]|uniref:hypothetical protein n=1 Tax=Actinoplanes sp. NPDC049316 TaxID=3154727 RepID=UPI003432A0BC
MTAHQQPDRTPAVVFTIEQIHLTLDRLRESWEWLLELAEPGRAAPAASPALTDDQAERLEAVGHSDRAYRAYNLRHGMSALPPSPAAARIAIIDAQAHAGAAIMDAVHLVAAAADSVYVGGRPDQAATVRTALAWLDGPALDDVRDDRVAAAVDQLLQRADRTARQAAACTDDEVEPLVDPRTRRAPRCPACGRRSLQRERSTGRTAIRCVSQQCRCTGDGAPGIPECGCRREEKRPGKPHVWPPVDEPELWAAINATPEPERPAVGRGAAGHGGWQSRDMAGQHRRRWWTTEQAADQLDVDPARIRDWVRRAKTAGHVTGAAPQACPACLQRKAFPHVDAPKRVGARAAYLADQLLEAEAYTATSRRGKARA